MWLATLAESRPADAADIGDPAGDAVERFLKWEDDPARRCIAMTAALPRVLNQDMLAAVAPADQARELFGWLCGLPFVTRRAGIMGISRSGARRHAAAATRSGAQRVAIQ